MIGATLLMQEVARRGLLPAFLKFNPNHEPAGSPEGGQFSSGEGGASAEIDAAGVSVQVNSSYTDTEKQHIREYQNGASINGLLRDAESAPFAFQQAVAQQRLRDPLYARQIQALDSAIDKGRLGQDTIFYRGINLALASMPASGVLKDPAFIAVTTDKSIAVGFGSVVEYAIPAGTHILDVSTALGDASRYAQKEFILPRGLTFAVSRKADGSHRLTLAGHGKSLGTALLLKEVRARELWPAYVARLKYSEDQPREPAGSPEGGQFAGGEGGGGSLPTHDAAQRTLRNAAMLYGMNFIDSRKVAKVSEAMLTGGDIDDAGINAGASGDHIEAAGELVRAIRQSNEVAVPLFRGVGSNVPLGNIEHLRVGETVSLNRITSFSQDRDQAAYYAQHADYKYSSHRYEFQTVGPIKAFATDAHSGLAHNEYITQGKFIVSAIATDVNYTDSYRYTRVITLQQVGVF